MASRKLTVEILGDSKSLERAFSRSSRSAQKFSVGIGTIAKSAVVFGAVTAAADGLGNALRSGVGEFSDAAKVAAQTQAAIKSTGAAANVTARQVSNLAGRIAGLSGLDDEAVQAGENLILTFRNVRNEAGKGNRIFDRATKAAVNLSVAGFGSIDTTAKQLGKALNDPVRGLTALSRAGVTFTDSQKKAITAMVESGRLLDAQKTLLREVETQVGGSAKALGQTLPGQLSKLRESFKNTLGSLVGSVAPAVAGALGDFNRFLGELGKARTVSAKLSVVWSGVRDAAAGATSLLGDAVARIDFDKVWERARGVADGLQKRLAETDFSVVGRRIGEAFTDAAKVALPAAKDLASRVTAAAREIDFEALGRTIGPGLATAVVVAFTSLLDPAFWVRNWDLALAVAAVAFKAPLGKLAGKLLAPMARLGSDLVLRIGVGMLEVAPRLGALVLRVFGAVPALVARALGPLVAVVSRVFGRLGRIASFVVKVLGIQAALNAVVGFARSVGRTFSQLGGSIGGALDAAWEKLKEGAIRAALAIVEPFSHIPQRLGGGVFQDLKQQFQRQLDGMGASAERTATRIQTAIDRIEGRRVEISIDAVVNAPGGGRRPEEGAGARSIAQAAKAAKNAADAASTAATRTAEATGAAAAKAADAVKASAAKARQAAARAKAAADRQRAAFDTLLDSLQLGLDKAAVTRRFTDDLAALAKIETAVQAQIRVEGRTAELERRLFDVRQRRAEIRKQLADQARQRTQARQFRALGLGAEGQELIPGVANLRKQLASLTERLGDTGVTISTKLRSQLAGARKVLSGELGKATDESRARIKELFATIRQAFGQESRKGPLTKTSALNTAAIVKGLGLDPETAKAIRARLSGFNTAGRALAPQPALAGISSRPFVIENHTTVELDGQKVGTSVTRHQQRTARRNPAQKRGPQARDI